jgi:hypothetical protein
MRNPNSVSVSVGAVILAFLLFAAAIFCGWRVERWVKHQNETEKELRQQISELQEHVYALENWASQY